MEEVPFVLDSARAVEYIRAIPDARIRYRADRIYRLIAAMHDARAPTALIPVLVGVACVVLGNRWPQYSASILVSGLVIGLTATRWSYYNVTKPTTLMLTDKMRDEIAARGDNGLKESLLKLAELEPELQEGIMEAIRYF